MTLSPREQCLEGQVEEFRLKTFGSLREQGREHLMKSPITQ